MEELVQLNRQLAECGDKVNTLQQRLEDLTDFIENASVPLHWANSDGIIIWANQTELDLLGYSREEYLGWHIRHFHADKKVIDEFLARLKNNETLCNYPARLRCKNGGIKHVLMDSNVRWKEGKFMHTRCFTRDVTESKKFDQFKAEQIAVLEEANRLLRIENRSLKELLSGTGQS